MSEHVICPGFSCNPKRETAPDLLGALFRRHRTDHHAGATEYYTDGCKDGGCVGSAAIGANSIITRKLPPSASIFTAELSGIIDALTIIRDGSNERSVIFVDSKSAIQVSTQYDSSHPMINRITGLLMKIASRRKTVTICWCPSHVGIRGNETADSEASEAAHSNKTADNIASESSN